MPLDRKHPSPSPAPWILSDVCAGITPVIGSVSLLKPKLWRENKIVGRKENGDTALFSPTTGFSPVSVSKNPTVYRALWGEVFVREMDTDEQCSPLGKAMLLLSQSRESSCRMSEGTEPPSTLALQWPCLVCGLPSACHLQGSTQTVPSMCHGGKRRAEPRKAREAGRSQENQAEWEDSLGDLVQ